MGEAYSAEIKVLQDHANLDLWALPFDDVEKIANAFNRLRPPELRPAFIGSLRWTNGLEYVVFVEASPVYGSEEEATVRTTIVHTNAALPGCTQQFSAGYRTQITGFETLRDGATKGSGDLLAIGTLWGKEYYAMAATEGGEPVGLLLIRAEDSNGRAGRTMYGRDDLMIGPWPGVYMEFKWAVDAADYWTRRLRRGSLTDILSGLLYLSSDHTYPDTPGLSYGRKQEEMITKDVPQALVRNGTLEKLLGHEHPWVREQAQILKCVMEGRP